jgi:DNA (cytosine-5)-methyltransferase 1
MMRHVDLCSGIGGFALGFEWAGLSRPVMFCDIEPWSRKVLAKHWPDVPIEEDVKVLANEPEKIPAGGRDTILTAGYPCQPWSQAGRRLGAADDRHIWPYIREIVAQKRPAWCVFENVYGHVSLGLDQVLLDMETDGYAARGFIVPACGVDAPHRRDRVWIIGRFMGDTEHDGSSATAVEGKHGQDEGWRAEGQGETEQSARTGEPGDHADVGDTEGIGRYGWAEETGRARQTHQPDEPRPEIRGELGGSGEDVANADSARCEEQWWGEPAQSQYQAAQCGDWWVTEPPVGRLAHGIPNRVDQLKGLGNAIVPQIAMRIGIAIRQCEASATGQSMNEKES